MAVKHATLTVTTNGPGLVLITSKIEEKLRDLGPTGPGLLHVFIKHTSASLLIQENASPSAKQDLEEFIDRLAPEGESWYRHLEEGPDDTVSHMKCAVTPISLTVPTEDARLMLGTWQGIYLWEHRQNAHHRQIVLTLMT